MNNSICKLEKPIKVNEEQEHSAVDEIYDIINNNVANMVLGYKIPTRLFNEPIMFKDGRKITYWSLFNECRSLLKTICPTFTEKETISIVTNLVRKCYDREKEEKHRLFDFPTETTCFKTPIEKKEFSI